MSAPTRKCDCGADIFFAVTEKNRRMPLDAKPIPGVVVLLPNGAARVVKAYRSHHSTCPLVEKYRQDRRQLALLDESQPAPPAPPEPAS